MFLELESRTETLIHWVFATVVLGKRILGKRNRNRTEINKKTKSKSKPRFIRVFCRLEVVLFVRQTWPRSWSDGKSSFHGCFLRQFIREGKAACYHQKITGVGKYMGSPWWASIEDLHRIQLAEYKDVSFFIVFDIFWLLACSCLDLFSLVLYPDGKGRKNVI